MSDFNTATHNELLPIYERGLGEVPIQIFDGLCQLGARTTVFSDRQAPAWIKAIVSGDHAELSDDGEYKLSFGVWRDGFLRDIAFDHDGSIATLFGLEPVLNFDALTGWADQFRDLRIFRSLVDWLIAEGDGVVILNDKAAWEIFRRFDNIEGDDKEHCRHLREILQPPHRKIHFTFKREVAA